MTHDCFIPRNFLQGKLAKALVIPEPPATSEWLDGRRYRLAHGKIPKTLAVHRTEQGGGGRNGAPLFRND